MNISPEFRAIRNKAAPLSELLTDPKLYEAYGDQFRNAKRRGIEFKLSYEEWLIVWLTAGADKLANRGRQNGQYCMSRYHDKGAYEIGNVYIQTINENTRTGPQGLGHKKSRKHRQKLRALLDASRKYCRVSANGVIYTSMTAAGKAHDISPQAVMNRIKSNSKSFRNWKVVKTVRGDNVIPFPGKMEIVFQDEVMEFDFTDDMSDVELEKLVKGEF